MTRARARSLAVACAPGALMLLLLVAGPAHAQGVQLDTAGPGTALGLRAARMGNHLAMALTVGFLLIPAWLLPLRADRPEELVRRAARCAGWAGIAWVATACALFAFGVSNAAARPLPEALVGDLPRRFLDTRFGLAIAIQGAGAAIVAVLALLSGLRVGSPPRRASAWVVLAGALVAGAAPAWWGHAGTADVGLIAVANAWLHIAAAAAWVGGLAAVTILVVRSGLAGTSAALGRYSTLAGWSLAGVLVTGVVNTAVHVSSPVLLLDTTWGRLAVVKAVLLAAIGGLGYVHRRRSIPAVRRAGADGRRLFRRVAAVELVLMLVVLGVAATMSSGMPADAEAASRIQTVRAALGDGLVEVTLDPARVGRNELHLYLYDERGGLLPVEEASLALAGPTARVEAALLPSGPGHYTAFGVDLAEPGTHRITVEVLHEGQTLRATASIPVR